jgi:transcriptional antiterminator NusG
LDKRYKDTLLIFSNESTTDPKKYGKHFEASKKVRQRRLYATPTVSTARNCVSWGYWIYNSVCVFSIYIWIGKIGSRSKVSVRTTGGQEKIVMNLLQARAKMNKINIQSVLLVDNLKGYVVIEALDPNAAYEATEGIRHIRGQLRGELDFKDIEGYLVKKPTVTQLSVDNVVEITGGPFKGMKATITRIDHEKEEATVVLLDASYQLPVTVDANYLKLVSAS